MAFYLTKALYKTGDEVTYSRIYHTIKASRYDFSTNKWTYLLSMPLQIWVEKDAIKLVCKPSRDSYSNLMNLVRNNVKVVELPSGEFEWTTI